MIRFPVPDIIVGSIFDITPEFLAARNVELLLLDLDNTIATYAEQNPSQELKDRVNLLLESGIRLYIVSNNRGSRPERFAQMLGIGYIKSAKKPFTAETKKLLRELNADLSRTALAGDQIFTDALCARGIGITSIVVTPKDLGNPLLKTRYALEGPFRWAYEMRRKKIEKNRKNPGVAGDGKY